jgi:hypothetical protein
MTKMPGMSKELSWKAATIPVLQDATEPLTAQEIVQGIVERKLKTVLGATPWATVAALLSVSIANEGAESPFIRPEKGRFALRAKCGQSAFNDPLQEVSKQGSSIGALPAKGIINALGMFWERSKVDWKGPQSKLLGNQSDGKSVDFGNQRGIYLLHDTQGVLYVGKAYPGPLGQRLWQHYSDRLGGRWTRFSWFGLYPVTEDGALQMDAALPTNSVETLVLTLEALLIEALEPRQNRKRGDTNFEDIEFLQFEDPKFVAGRKKAMLEEMMSSIKAG